MKPKHFLSVPGLAGASVRMAIVAATLSLVAAGCSFNGPRATGTKTTAAPHAPASAIAVESRNGSVEITADASRSDVEITATVTCTGETQQQADQRLADASIEVARDTAHKLIIKPIFPGGARDNDGAGFVIRIPDADGVNINTSNGRVTVQSLKGTLVIDTSNASVNVTDHDGAAMIDTSNGSVNVKNLAGDLRVDTSNASVVAEGIKGMATVDTSNGPIDLALNPDQPGPIVLDTSNASISVRVGRAFIGKVTMDTSNGSINATGPEQRINVVSRTKKHVVAQAGEGGEPSTISTSNGRIDFEIAD